MSKHPVVSDCEFSKTLLGHWKLEFKCPACLSELNSKESAVGTVDDCPHCGTQFVFSQSVVNQLDTLKAAELLEKQAKQEKTEKRRKESENQRSKREQEQEKIRREQEAEARRREDERGYDYPNLRRYQTSLEWTAIVGAVIFGLMGLAALAGAWHYGVNSDEVSWGTIFLYTVVAVASFLAAWSWYFWWMVVAEFLRLTVTAALDIRTIRDNSGRGRQQTVLER